MSRLVFTRAWEDDRVDLAVLGEQPGRRVLVVAGAGESALALATAGPACVIAVDRSAAQLHLVALKIAAATALRCDVRHLWFEDGHAPDAPSVYRRAIRGELAPATAAFWDRQIDLFVSGFHDHVGVGRTFSRLGRLVRLLVPGITRAIEQSPTVAEQALFWHERVRGRMFNPLTHWAVAHTRLMAPFAPDPNELARMRTHRFFEGFERRVDSVVEHNLVREHPWWRPAFSGRAADPGNGAVWLDPDRADALAEGVGRIRLVESDLIAALDAQPEGSLDAVSVSNVPDWLPRTEHPRLAAAVERALVPGGRVLVRTIMADESPFDGSALVRDPWSDDLVAADRTALYGRVDLLRKAGTPASGGLRPPGELQLSGQLQ